MITCQLKLRLNHTQEKTLEAWLPILGAVWNFAIRKIELNAKDHIYFSRYDFTSLLNGHYDRIGIPAHTLCGVLDTAHTAWRRCFKGISRRPRLKGARRPCNSIPFPDPIPTPKNGKVRLIHIGWVRFHEMEIPVGPIKCARLCKRASGWHLCLFIDAAPNAIPREAGKSVGIDTGFNDLITLSTGEKVEHPREWEAAQKRLAKAQRGHSKRLTARVQERTKNRRRDRNHKLSRRLVAENSSIFFLQDNHRAISKRFGKSVGDSAHGQLRQMLVYKSLIGGTRLVFPENRNSTRACSTCGALTGPQGLAGLKVRQWTCGVCGTQHERDVNAARNALIVGAGSAHGVQKSRVGRINSSSPQFGRIIKPRTGEGS